MRTETETRITSWETRPVENGYAGLHALAEAAFSGAITANETWLFMLDGRPIGLSDGPIESFSEGDSTAYVAAHPALSLLFAMRERGGETTARYYTDDTPLADTAETLSSSEFTGYVELSENFSAASTTSSTTGVDRSRSRSSARAVVSSPATRRSHGRTRRGESTR
ncbi:hypothetical protein ACFQKF_07750 [Halalkalicoccus sp. GCM10025322]|uniref:hypothetical protein n=1 Tax=Halalkalicoccus TaxID=332246 RepID=UPI002F9635E7